MRQFTEDTLTDAVLARLKDAKHPRFKQIITSAVKHLHAFARDVQLTEEEWFEASNSSAPSGQKCDDKRQEFILLSDILGLSMMVLRSTTKTPPGATEATVLGPFFVHGAPEFEYGADFTKGATVEGETTWVTGRVLSIDGKPIPTRRWTSGSARQRRLRHPGSGRRIRAARARAHQCRRPLCVQDLQAAVLRRARRRPGRRPAARHGPPPDAPGAHARDRVGGRLPAGDHACIRGRRSLSRLRCGIRGEGIADRPLQASGFTRGGEEAGPVRAVPAPGLDFRLAPAGTGKTRQTVAASDAVT